MNVNVLMSKGKRKEVVPFRLCSCFVDSSCADTKIAPKMASVENENGDFAAVSLTDAPSDLNPRRAMFNGILYEGISTVI